MIVCSYCNSVPPIYRYNSSSTGIQIPTDEDIRAARENNGLTQAELADRAGVS
jgi:DNA-binding transcriptional regulator YiaG